MSKAVTKAYEFKYEGEFQSLDALTVLNTQLNFVTILSEIKEHVYPEAKLDIRIEGAEKGSLIINHFIEIASVSGMFILDNYTYVKTLFEVLIDLIKIYKFLDGKKPDKVEKTGDGSVNLYLYGSNNSFSENAFNIFCNSGIINNAMNNTSKILLENNDVTSIELNDKEDKKQLMHIDRSEFEKLGRENPFMDKQTIEDLKKNQILFVYKSNLFPDPKKKWVWEFIHKGRNIKATIKDPEFLKKINQGLRLGQGDRLKADLKVFCDYDERLGTHIESGKYEVSNISDIIYRSGENKINFN